MDYAALFARRTSGIALGLEIVAPAFVALGRPGAGIPALHVVGTNGKGSIAALAAHVATRRGQKVGLYTSPHLTSVRERVRVAGCPAERRRFDAALATVLEVESRLVLPRPLSFFEVLTLAAMQVFAEEGVDTIVAEAGLGGRLDATRIVDAHVVAFATIGLDHQAYLGDTIAVITGEKAAVMRAGIPAVTGPQVDDAMTVLAARAREVGCPLHVVEPLARPPEGLPGLHQRSNAAVALAAVRLLEPGAAIPETMLDGVAWPGRLETVALGAGRVVFDVAHNPQAIAAVVAWMQTQAFASSVVVVFACAADKDVRGMLVHLRVIASELWWVPLPEQDRAPVAAELGREPSPPARGFSGVSDGALAAAVREHTDRGGTVLVCGSHVLVGALRGVFGAPPTTESAGVSGSVTATDPTDPR